jgi:hypothetical protein
MQSGDTTHRELIKNMRERVRDRFPEVDQAANMGREEALLWSWIHELFETSTGRPPTTSDDVTGEMLLAGIETYQRGYD